jgi:hypothetical protein
MNAKTPARQPSQGPRVVRSDHGVWRGAYYLGRVACSRSNRIAAVAWMGELKSDFVKFKLGQAAN